MLKSSLLSNLACQDQFLRSYILRNRMGSYVVLSNYGARIVEWVVPDKNGKMDNIVLGYPLLSDYFDDSCYLGATIGPVANRIAQAQFYLDGQLCVLDVNDGENTNHGGFRGIDQHVFQCIERTSNRIVFATKTRDGEGGFPGGVVIRVIYSYSDDYQLRIEYRATTDKKTVLNLTNHAYFNLSACRHLAVKHYLKIRSSHILASDSQYIPSGEIISVQGTRWDFSELTVIERKSPELRYNDYYIVDGQSSENSVATLYDSFSGRKLEVYTSYPGMFFYSADYLSSVHEGNFGRRFIPYDGICLEAQFYPDAVNHADFPDIELSPGEEYKQYILFHLQVE